MKLRTPDFESLKRINDQGQPYWSARELSEKLGYGGNWRGFEQVIKKAMAACATDNIAIIENFFEVEITIQQGRATRKISDYFLSKRACRYIAMQGNTRLPEIAAALSYFNYAVESHEMHELKRQTDEEHLLNIIKSNNLPIDLCKITESNHELRDSYIRDEIFSFLIRKDSENEIIAADDHFGKVDTKGIDRGLELRKELESRRNAIQKKIAKEKQMRDGK